MGGIQLDIAEELTAFLGNSPEQIERRALESIVLDLYRRRELSAGSAAGFLGLDKFAFIRWAGELGIPHLDMTAEEWQEELRVIRKR